MTKTTKSKIITHNEVLSAFSANLVDLIQKGYVVTSGVTNFDYPKVYLTRGHEHAALGLDTTRNRRGKFTYYEEVVLEFTVDGLTTTLETFYKLDVRGGAKIYTKELEFVDHVANLQEERLTSRYIAKKEKKIKTKKAIDYAKTLPRFKSVPRKNIEISRVPGQLGYKIVNTETRTIRLVGAK